MRFLLANIFLGYCKVRIRQQGDRRPVVIAVVGSRNWPMPEMVHAALSRYLKPGDKIVSGGARGPDSLAAEYAKNNGIPLIEYIPDWNRFGRRAGFLRNQEIVDVADKMIAFQYNNSKGTGHSIRLAESKRIPVLLITMNVIGGKK